MDKYRIDEIIKKAEAEARITKPPIVSLSSKRSAFLNKGVKERFEPSGRTIFHAVESTPSLSMVTEHCWSICKILDSTTGHWVTPNHPWINQPAPSAPYGPFAFQNNPLNPTWSGTWSAQHPEFDAFYDWVVSNVGGLNVGDTILFDMNPSNAGMCSLLGYCADAICFKYEGQHPSYSLLSPDPLHWNYGFGWPISVPLQPTVSLDSCCSSIVNTFDCQDCNIIIQKHSSINSILFKNQSTGAATVVTHPEFASIGEIAKYDNKFWTKTQDNTIAVDTIKEFEIGPNCTVTHIRDIALPLVNGQVFGSSGSGMCAKNSTTLIVGKANMMYSGQQGMVELEISGNVAVATFLFAAGHVAGDLVYIPSSNTIAATISVNNNMEAQHLDMSGNILGQTTISILAPFSMWSFGDDVYFNTSNSVFKFDLTSYTVTPQPFTLPNAVDAASSPNCISTYVTDECYYIGDTGPEGGIIFEVPLGHPQNVGINQSDYYYEAAASDIAIGSTPQGCFNDSCGEEVTYTHVILGSYVSSHADVDSNELTIFWNPITAYPGVGSNPPIQVGDVVTASPSNGFPVFFDALGNPLQTTTIASVVPNPVVLGVGAGPVQFTITDELNPLMDPSGNFSIPFNFTVSTVTASPCIFQMVGSEWGAYNQQNIQTSQDFGFGQKNTDIIDAYPQPPNGGVHPVLDTHDIAATLCKQQGTITGFDDWFLPSHFEFWWMNYQLGDPSNSTYALSSHAANQLMLTTTPGQDSEHYYWTSSKEIPANVTLPDEDKYAWAFNASTSYPELAYRCHTLSVRPIRRFKCTPPEPPEPPCTGCGCIDYNWRDMYLFSSVGSGYVGHLGQSSGPIPNISAPLSDSWMGGDNIKIWLGSTDVMGNEWTEADWQDDSLGYTITVWNRWYGYVGKWKYDNFVTSTEYFSNQPVMHPLLPSSIIMELSGVTHLDGPSPFVDYNIGPNGGNLSTSTKAFFKIEAACNDNLPTAFENGCNHLFTKHDVPYVCLHEDPPVGYVGIGCIPSFGTYQPPNYFQSNTACYVNPCIPFCVYQIGDIGPAGGTIVATPWMSAGTITTNGIAENNTQYYFEMAPDDINLPHEWGNYNVDTTISQNNSNTYTNGGYLNDPGVASGAVNTSTMITNYNPILPFSGGDVGFIGCDNYASGGYSDWFLPSVEELWFIRNNLPGTLSGLRWSSNFFNDFYPDPDSSIRNHTYFNTSSYDSPSQLALAVDLGSTVTNDPSTGNLLAGDYFATETVRFLPFPVRPMRKFECITPPQPVTEHCWRWCSFSLANGTTVGPWSATSSQSWFPGAATWYGPISLNGGTYDNFYNDVLSQVGSSGLVVGNNIFLDVSPGIFPGGTLWPTDTTGICLVYMGLQSTFSPVTINTANAGINPSFTPGSCCGGGGSFAKVTEAFEANKIEIKALPEVRLSKREEFLSNSAGILSQEQLLDQKVTYDTVLAARSEDIEKSFDGYVSALGLSELMLGPSSGGCEDCDMYWVLGSDQLMKKQSPTSADVLIFDMQQAILGYTGTTGLQLAPRAEIAKFGNKMWFMAQPFPPPSSGGTYTQFDQHIVEVQLNSNCDGASITKVMTVVPPQVWPWDTAEFIRVMGALTAKDSTTLIGMFASFHLPQNITTNEGKKYIAEFDVSGVDAHMIIKFPTPGGNAPWYFDMDTESLDDMTFTDTVYLPQSNSIIGVSAGTDMTPYNNNPGTKGVITWMDYSTGNVIDQIYPQDPPFPGSTVLDNPPGIFSMAAACHDGKIYGHNYNVPVYGNELYEIIADTTTNTLSIGNVIVDSGYAWSDAASSPWCCGTVSTTPASSWNCTTGGCVDPGDGSGQFSSLHACNDACTNYECVYTGLPSPNAPSGQSCVTRVGPLSFLPPNYYTSLADCQVGCTGPPPPPFPIIDTWDCEFDIDPLGNNPPSYYCVQKYDGSGQHTTLLACQIACKSRY